MPANEKMAGFWPILDLNYTDFRDIHASCIMHVIIGLGATLPNHIPACRSEFYSVIQTNIVTDPIQSREGIYPQKEVLVDNKLFLTH